MLSFFLGYKSLYSDKLAYYVDFSNKPKSWAKDCSENKIS